MKKRVLATALIAAGMAASTQADTLTYNFDADLNASGTSIATASALTATHGSNSDASATRQMSQGWYSRDTGTDGVFFSSVRSVDNKATTDNSNAATSLDMTAGAPSYVSFTLNAGTGNTLNFAGSTLTLDGMVYADAAIQYWLDLQVWASTDGGTTWSSAGTHQEITNTGAGTVVSTMYADSAKTTAINGWGLTGNVKDTGAALSFDLSGLGAASQTVELAVALSGTRDNHANWGTSMDDLSVNNFTVIPEPATLGMVAMVGVGIIFIRRRFMI